jgi:predicted transcriptional regulator
MLYFHLSVQPKTEQRLKIILNSIEDEENFAQSIINTQIERLQKAILNLRLDLKAFEQKYQIKSEQFYQEFSQGILADEEDFMIWSGLYEMLSQNEIQLQKLI